VASLSQIPSPAVDRDARKTFSVWLWMQGREAPVFAQVAAQLALSVVACEKDR
jgi:hypothetical protein